MIKVSVMYPNGPESRFDDVYYREQHMPLVKERMGDALLYYTVDRALAAGKSDPNAPYIAMGHLFCESQQTFQAGFGPHSEEILGDIPNFTNQKPVMQFSEVLVGHDR